MSAEVWSAILNPDGPNYATWRETLGAEKVPLKSCHPTHATLGTETDVEVYMLDLGAMTLGQRARLVSRIATTFKVTCAEVEAELAKTGFPIRAVDVIVAIDMRAFI